MANDILYGSDARERMLAGVNKLADAVRGTLGPAGRYALLYAKKDRYYPLPTNDGVTIAESIEFEDRFENMGAQLVKKVASHTNDLAGDGTTTATILAQYILNEGHRNVMAGAEPLAIKRGIQGAGEVAAKAIAEIAQPADTREALERVAVISAEDAEIGKLVADAYDAVGTDATVTMEESGDMTTSLRIVEGMQINQGFLIPQMAEDLEHMTLELENVAVLVTDAKISDSRAFLSIMEQVVSAGKSFLVIADEMDKKCLGTLMYNIAHGAIKGAAINPPGFAEIRKEYLDDIALYTGATYISHDLFGYNLSDVTFDMLGSAEKVRIELKNTAIIGGGGDPDAIASRIGDLRRRADDTADQFDRVRLIERLSYLDAGVGLIRVGGATETEVREKRMRVEDAINAARSAAAEGVVPGGGATYLDILPQVQAYADSLEGDEATGARIVCKALEGPARQIAENSHIEGDIAINKIRSLGKGVGYNASTGEYCDMVKAGIIDSAKVSRLALECAISASSVLLTTETSVAEH